MSIKSISIVAAAAMALFAVSAQAQNKFANGGFEDAQSTLPSITGPVPAPDATKAQGWIPAAQGYVRSADARSGSWSALVNQTGVDNAGVMFQNSKDTGGMPDLVVGETLTLSFWAKAAVPDSTSFYNMNYALRFLNDNGNILGGSGNQFFQGQINSSTWTLITGAPMMVPAGATAAFLEFSAAGGGRLAAYKIDDVALVPEPGTYALMLAGLAGVGFMARRRRAV